MSELLNTLGSLIASLGNVQGAGVLKEHVSLLRSQLEFVKERVEALEKENGHIIKRCAELEQQLARQNMPAEFVEKRGALFKRLAGGGYDETPFCPACKRSMWCFDDVFPYECSDDSCGHKADFKGGELKSVLQSLAT
jgi:hypothetical protein